MKKGKSESGQAIILIVFGIIAMVGLTALAIDGGNAYADRRQAQSAADTAALAGALAKINNPGLSGTALQSVVASAVQSRAASNGYANNGTTSTVQVFNPPISGQFSCANSPANCNDYIQVVITSTTKTYFAPVVGMPQITNTVEAVAKAKLGTPGMMDNGAAIAGLQKNGCDSVYIAGNGQLQTWGGGLFSNSTSSCGMHFQGSANVQTHQGSGGINMVGSGYQTTGNPSIDTHNEGFHTGLQQQPYPPLNLPNPICAGQATQSGSTLSPGTYNGNFPPNGVTNLQPGIYCIYGDWSQTTGNLSGSNVVLVFETGAINLRGNMTSTLRAPTSGPFTGLLIYAPISNTNGMHLNGDINLDWVGTVLLPAGPVFLNGNNTQSQKTNSQIIGYTVEISGSADVQINMDPSKQYQPTTPSIIELSK
jgi:Flp pilus assembly protein TadG